MNNTRQVIKCLFGYHDYKIPDKKNPFVLICKCCRRFGYRKWTNKIEVWYEYNEKGNMIYRKHFDGFEIWFNDNGDVTHCKYPDGYEEWYDREGNIVQCKRI